MTRGSRARGVVLLCVLVVVAIAALVGTTVMYLALGERGAAEVGIDRTQARALAWSGVQGALAELAEQRDVLLTGGTPELTPEWTLFTDDVGRRGVVRLAAIGPGGEVAVSESAKLSINTATKEMLAKMERVGEDLAARIVEERAKRPFDSAEDLARVEGVTSELLYGEPESDGDAGESSGPGESRGERPSRRANPGRVGTRREAAADAGRDGGSTSGLVDVLTAFAFDANIQAGLGEDGAAHRGTLRINLNTSWSDELGAAVGERFGQDAIRGVEEVFKSGTKFKKDADIVGKLRELNLPPESWAVFLDAFTTCPDPYLIGRVDLSSAPAEVLACVPGLDADAAAEIVAAREGLDEQSRLDPAWPAARKIVPPEKWQEATDWVTTRSLVWRVRVEAGLLPAEAEEGAEIEERMVLDAVLDVTSERPRVAYLREVTFLPLALAMERRLASAEEEGDGAEPEELSEPADAPSDSASQKPAGTPVGPRSGPAAGVEPRMGDRADTSGTDPSGGPGRGARESPASPADAERRDVEPPQEPKDRRLGRWTTGGKG